MWSYDMLFLNPVLALIFFYFLNFFIFLILIINSSEFFGHTSLPDITKQHWHATHSADVTVLSCHTNQGEYYDHSFTLARIYWA